MTEQTDQTTIDVLSTKCERAYLITIQKDGMNEQEAEFHIEELTRLVDTMGIGIVGTMIVRVKKLNARYLIGQGKINEIIGKAKDKDSDIIIFDDDLSPSQQRNIEELSQITVIDRHEVILDIFADRATTRDAILQVGLARMQYSLPRLKRAWTHLSRQRGGAKGTRGEGEMQLEVDRRLVMNKINQLKKELKKVKQHRAIQRKKRHRVPLPSISLVGYTNAGKSSLLNKLTDANVFIEDKLFATLDPTTRKIKLDNGQVMLLTDTVGFIRKLPHDLVEAFKSTLEETVLSDFLIHVLDVSNTEVDEHFNTTLQVLEEIHAHEKSILTVFNKIDLLEKDSNRIHILKNRYPDALFISTHTREGFDSLLKEMNKLIAHKLLNKTFNIPHERYDIVSFIHRNGQMIKEEHTENNYTINCLISEKINNKVEKMLES
jgi:GTP-binding protein HflX